MHCTQRLLAGCYQVSVANPTAVAPFVAAVLRTTGARPVAAAAPGAVCRLLHIIACTDPGLTTQAKACTCWWRHCAYTKDQHEQAQVLNTAPLQLHALCCAPPLPA
eukprot:1159974-Pelagomonas_calceolata.AAC.6